MGFICLRSYHIRPDVRHFTLSLYRPHGHQKLTMVGLWKLQIKSYFVIAPLKEVVSGLSDFSCKSASNTQTVWYFPDRKKTLEYSFESFSSRERIGNIIWYEIIDFNCKGRKQILHAWKMFLWRANQMHQLNFDNRFPIESKCFLLIALERVTQRFSASGCQRQNRLLSNSTFDVRHHYLSKSSEFRQTSHCLTAHGKIINSVQPLNNLIISTSPISLTLASSQWNVYLTFECFETSRPIYLWKVGYIWLYPTLASDFY